MDFSVKYYLDYIQPIFLNISHSFKMSVEGYLERKEFAVRVPVLTKNRPEISKKTHAIKVQPVRI
jgi:hypothetical protein